MEKTLPQAALRLPIAPSATLGALDMTLASPRGAANDLRVDVLTPEQRLQKTVSMPVIAADTPVSGAVSADRGEPSAIESMAPHLVDKLTMTWGSPELHQFLSRVTMMDRPDRQGFAPEVASELFTLFLLNKEIANVIDEVDKFR
jgi:hypothetical protein